MTVSRKKKTSRQAQVNKLDKLFSLIVRSHGRCVVCDTTQNLQCAHGFSRRHRATRWDFRNAFSLCRGHHVYFTHRPLEWDDWLRDRWGETLYWEIRHLALSDQRPDLDELLLEFGEQWAQIASVA